MADERGCGGGFGFGLGGWWWWIIIIIVVIIIFSGFGGTSGGCYKNE